MKQMVAAPLPLRDEPAKLTSLYHQRRMNRYPASDPNAHSQSCLTGRAFDRGLEVTTAASPQKFLSWLLWWRPLDRRHSHPF